MHSNNGANLGFNYNEHEFYGEMPNSWPSFFFMAMDSPGIWIQHSQLTTHKQCVWLS